MLKDEMRQFFFGQFSAEIDEARCHGLYHGSVPVALSDAPRKVLFTLLQHRPRPVLAKALLKELWHSGANPSNVAKQVRALRLAMGDEHSGRYIRTVNKEGYAFVMPVAESPAGIGQTRMDQASIASVSATEWRLAQEKLIKDFRGSCLHDLELLDEAMEECDGRIRLIASHRRLRLHSRFPQPLVLVPPRRMASRRWAPPDEPDTEIASRTAGLIAYAKTTPVVVNVGPYSPACVSVLQSLRRRYGLELRSDFEGLSGRQQILRLSHDDRADFLLAPHAPFLLVGEHRALDYRWMSPIHAYDQLLLRMPGAARGRRRKLLIYKGGSPEEQLIARVGIPLSAHVEMVNSLERLIANVPDLDPGDMVIAWEPLASGLESKHQLRRSAEFRCWVSLYCHKRWQRGALRALKDQFRQLFTSEWIYCRTNAEWAMECLAVELRALEFFVAGSGLGTRS